MSTKVAEAKIRAKEAEEALWLAEREAAALEAAASLKEASYKLWYACDRANWADGTREASQALDAARDHLARTCLGAEGRVAKLIALDPERWPVGEDSDVHYYSYTTDDDLAREVATMIFDRGFGRGQYYEENRLEWEATEPGEVERFAETCEEIHKALGEELGGLAIAAWKAGRHDT